MSPALSIAMLPIQREFPSAGAKVPCWNKVGAPAARVVPLVLRSSYHRTPVTLECLLPLTLTEWLTTRDSFVPKLRYANRYIKRSPSESSDSLVPGCGMQLPPLQASVKAATDTLVGPENDELAGFAKSTWNFQRLSELVPKFT